MGNKFFLASLLIFSWLLNCLFLILLFVEEYYLSFIMLMISYDVIERYILGYEKTK